MMEKTAVPGRLGRLNTASAGSSGRFAAALALAAGAAAAAAGPTCPDTATFIGGPIAAWFDSSVWSTSGPNPIPGASDLASFLRFSPATSAPLETLYAPVENNPMICGLEVQDLDVRLIMDDALLQLSGTGLTMPGDGKFGFAPAHLSVDVAPGAAFGGLRTDRVAIATVEFGRADVTIQPMPNTVPPVLELGSPVGVPVPVSIGDRGWGSLDIIAADFVSLPNQLALIGLAETPGAIGDLTFRNGAFGGLRAGRFDIGFAGEGLVDVRDSSLDLDLLAPLRIGVNPGSRGRLSVRGDAVFTAESNAILAGAERGAGEIQVLGSGLYAAPQTVIARRGRLLTNGSTAGLVELAGGEMRIASDDPSPGSDLTATHRGVITMTGLDPRLGRPVDGSLSLLMLSEDPADVSQLDLALNGGDIELAGALRVIASVDLEPTVGQRYQVVTAQNVFGAFSGFSRPVFNNGTTLELFVGSDEVVLEVVPTAPRVETPAEGGQNVGFIGEVRDGAAADFNGDGLEDAVFVTSLPDENIGSVVLLLSRGAAANGDPLGFEAEEVYFDSLIVDPVAIDAGDFNGDGTPDVAVLDASRTTSQIVVLANVDDQPNFRFQRDARGPITVRGMARGLRLEDIDGDGDNDLFVTSFDDAGPLPAFALGGAPASLLSAVMNNGAAIEVCDVDTGDNPDSVDGVQSVLFTGAKRAAVASKDGDSIAIHDPDGEGAYGPPMEVPVGVTPTDIVAVDLTGDGLEDLVTTDETGGTISVVVALPTAGEPDFAAPVIVTAALPQEFAMPSGVVAIDQDEDGDPDLAYIATQSGTRIVRYIPNDGLDGDVLLLGAPIDIPIPGSGEPTSLAVSDTDGDGDTDLVIAIDNPFARGLAPADNLFIADLGRSGCLADVSGDGRFDIADVVIFLQAMGAGDLAADFSPPFGTLDIADVVGFLQAASGCATP